MATLGAIDLTTEYENCEIKMITVAAPLVGDRMFKNFFNKTVPDGIRLVHDKDPVPRLPKGLLYAHVGHEVLLDRIGTILVDPSPMEKAFVERPRSRLACHFVDAYEEAMCLYFKKYLVGTAKLASLRLHSMFRKQELKILDDVEAGEIKRLVKESKIVKDSKVEQDAKILKDVETGESKRLSKESKKDSKVSEDVAARETKKLAKASKLVEFVEPRESTKASKPAEDAIQNENNGIVNL
eukprot:CAMPEP_0167742354 /NCGR_PEP_ID=MMETSP0110_2-20121227/1379_1 /TAXON_ID=629695 /ORGANISM="Gymnochlora sp., Strain CCMP2014" /LENGTH=239 /DNA_ID=CAMNT_0007626535 /DNA_START=1751 /DNA_END=2470 /DNA_ORIENTATION=+